MLQAKWTDEGVNLIDVDPGPVRPDWVRIRVAACGICGSDIHYYRRALPFPGEGIMGHEIVGTVEDGGKGLADSLYVIEPWVPCGECVQCIRGNRALCPKGAFIGVEYAGGIAEFVDVPRYTLLPVDPSVPPLVASISEPFGCAYRAVQLARLHLDSRVLIIGAGTIGLLSGLLARDRAMEVAITVRYPRQREAAERLGLMCLGEDGVEAWAKDREPDVVIELVGGTANTIDQAIQYCQPAGRVIVVGMFTKPSTVDALPLIIKELEILGCSIYGMGRHGRELGTTVAMVPRYQREIEGLQTHQFPLSSVEDAFACASDKTTGAIKVTILPK